VCLKSEYSTAICYGSKEPKVAHALDCRIESLREIQIVPPAAFQVFFLLSHSFQFSLNRHLAMEQVRNIPNLNAIITLADDIELKKILIFLKSRHFVPFYGGVSSSFITFYSSYSFKWNFHLQHSINRYTISSFLQFIQKIHITKSIMQKKFTTVSMKSKVIWRL